MTKYYLIKTTIGDPSKTEMSEFDTRFGVLRAYVKAYDDCMLRLDCDGYDPVPWDSLHDEHIVITAKYPCGKEEGNNKPRIEAVVLDVVTVMR